jgi:hypothetical protein
MIAVITVALGVGANSAIFALAGCAHRRDQRKELKVEFGLPSFHAE